MKQRIGRPPRTDKPTRINVRLPLATRMWLARQAQHEGRYEGDLIAALLQEYRERPEWKGRKR